MKHGNDLTDHLLSIWISEHESDERAALITGRAKYVAFKVILTASHSFAAVSCKT